MLILLLISKKYRYNICSNGQYEHLGTQIFSCVVLCALVLSCVKNLSGLNGLTHAQLMRIAHHSLIIDILNLIYSIY